MRRFWMIPLCLVLIMSLAACGLLADRSPAATAVPEEPAATVVPEEPAATVVPEEPAATAVPEEPESTEAPAEEDTAPPADEAEEEASPADAEGEEPVPALPEIEAEWTVNEEQYAAAQECVGRSVEELYDAIGLPPGGSQYAASCLEENAEDGMLHYDGFYVWTVRSDSGEIVHEVYLSE